MRLFIEVLLRYRLLFLNTIADGIDTFTFFAVVVVSLSEAFDIQFEELKLKLVTNRQ